MNILKQERFVYILHKNYQWGSYKTLSKLEKMFDQGNTNYLIIDGLNQI
jgi:hypothetical protein